MFLSLTSKVFCVLLLFFFSKANHTTPTLSYNWETCFKTNSCGIYMPRGCFSDNVLTFTSHDNVRHGRHSLTWAALPSQWHPPWHPFLEVPVRPPEKKIPSPDGNQAGALIPTPPQCQYGPLYLPVLASDWTSLSNGDFNKKIYLLPMLNK